MSSKNYGRKKILTDIVLNGDIQHDKGLIPKIIEASLPYHLENVRAYTTNERWYFNDTQYILTKQKHIRPEIDNQFTFATAKSVVEMNNGYCFGEPFKYVTNEAEEEKQEQMTAFNKCLKIAQNHKHTTTCAENGGKFGISYKLALKPTNEDIKKGKFFRIVSDLDNFKTFKVYSNTIEQEEVLGVVYYDKEVFNEDNKKKSYITVFNCWTKYHQWEFIKDSQGKYSNNLFLHKTENVSVYLEAFPLNISVNGVSRETIIPLQEFERTNDRVSDFELSIKLMDAINVLASCRLDSVQQSTDFIIKLRDIDLGEFDKETGENPVLERIQKYMKSHFLAVESRDGADVQPDIDVLDIPLNQSQVQELQDFLYEMLQEELQQPTRSGGTGQDTGIAVENRNGFRQFENHATKISDSMIYAEMQFIEKLLEIGKSYKECPFKNLNIGDIEIRSMRNKSENKTTAVNNFREMVNAGVNRITAYAESGLVADISDTVKMDEEQKIKNAKFVLNQEIEKEKEMQKLKNKTEKSVEDKNADGSVKTETVDEP